MRGNPHRGEVRFEAGGKEYVLRLGINAICALEAEFKTTISKIGAKLGKDNSAIMMRTVFRVVVRPPVSDEEAGDLIDEIGMLEAWDLLGEAFTRAFPEDRTSSNPRKAAASGIGAPS